MSGKAEYLLQDISEESFKDLHGIWTTTKGDFTLWITSGGGNTDVMWAIHDLIHYTSRSVTGIAIGYCHSAAPLILAVCDRRICSPNTEFMVHEDSLKLKGSPDQTLRNAIRAQASEQKWCARMAEYTQLSAAEWDELSKKETYIDADTAKIYGLVDKVQTILTGVVR